MISILTPTVREKGLDIVKKGLDRQTYSDFEWLIGSPFNPLMGKWVKDDFEGGVWSLNRIHNKMIKEAKGDLIVSVQDFTLINPEALEKFVFYNKKYPNAVISGVGDKYTEVYPQLGSKVWADPRKRSSGQFRACSFNEIEGNFCFLPKKALFDVGGFDESLDDYFGMDWYSVLHRLSILGGYEFYLDESNESYSLPHGRVDNWEEKNLIHKYAEVTKNYPNPVLAYLQ